MFTEDCYRLARLIPRGKVTTYKDIAHALGTSAYRAVGTAMKRNPHPSVPCHRVVRSDGDVGLFRRGREEKIALLRAEGVDVEDGMVDLEKYCHRFA